MRKLTSCILAGLLALCIALPVQAKQVPFKAISNPDFSKIVIIHVPDGWKHRNAEGTMELTPPKGDGYVCVAVFNLDGRTPQQMATLLAEGKTPDKCPERKDAWIWVNEMASGDSHSNFLVGSAKDDAYVHFSWRNVDESAVKAILANSVMAGAPVMPASTDAKGDASPNRVVEVKTAHELIAAIASNTTIKLAPGRYVLSDAVMGAVNADNGTTMSKKADGPQLNINGVRNLTIEGGDNFAEYQIVTDPTYADVMELSECEGIRFVGLTMGHTEPGECSGSVLSFIACADIEIDNCDLYGSGVYGINAMGVKGMKVTGGTIRDCSDNLVSLSDIKGATFTGVRMVNRNGAGPAVYLHENQDTPVEDVVFDRVNFVSDEEEKADMIFRGVCGKGFTVRHCTTRGVNGKEIPLDLGTDLSPKQIDGLGFNGEIIEYER